MLRTGRAAALALALLAATACADRPCDLPCGPSRARPPLDPGYRGPGQLLLVFEREAARELWTFGARGAHRVPVAGVREARWVAPGRLLALLETGGGPPGAPADTRLAFVEPAGGDTTPLGAPGRYYDAEPSPDGAFLAVSAEAPALGDSDLEIWSLGDVPARIAVRHQSLEEPRWRPDARALVASVLMADPETDDDTGGGFAGTSLAWPRLHLLRADLGDPQLLWDGRAPGTLAPGGTLPLWWDARGLFARQREGLVRCEPAADGCALVFASGERRRVVDGRALRVGRDGAVREEAWLLSVEAVDAFDRREPDLLHRVDLASGADRPLRTPPGAALVDIDWIADRADATGPTAAASGTLGMPPRGGAPWPPATRSSTSATARSPGSP